MSNDITNTSASSHCVVPRLIVSVGGRAVGTYDAANIDNDAIAEIRGHCDDAGAHISFELRHLHAWPDRPRYLVLAFLRDIGCSYSVTANGNAHATVFDAVLDSMVGTDDMSGHQMSMRAAFEAAALWHAETADSVAGLINDRLEELGVSRWNRSRLAKQIRNAAGRAHTNANTNTVPNNASGPQSLATAYHGHLCDGREFENDGPVLIFYRHEFFMWNENHWEPVADALLKTRVVEYMQRREIPQVTDHLAHDVIANLKAIVLIDCWHEAMPFRIDSLSPLAISRPNLLSFVNGVVDLDELINE